METKTINYNSSVITKIEIFQIGQYNFLKIYFVNSPKFYYYEIDESSFNEIVELLTETDSIGKTYSKYIKGKFKTLPREEIQSLYLYHKIDKNKTSESTSQTLETVKNKILKIDSEIEKLQEQKKYLLQDLGEIYYNQNK